MCFHSLFMSCTASWVMFLLSFYRSSSCFILVSLTISDPLFLPLCVSHSCNSLACPDMLHLCLIVSPSPSVLHLCAICLFIFLSLRQVYQHFLVLVNLDLHHFAELLLVCFTQKPPSSTHTLWLYLVMSAIVSELYVPLFV